MTPSIKSAYMGLPGDNVDGFTQGSPINFAHQFKGNLLVIHGTGDDNCHYQATEALINELVRHNKPFTMMAYPNRSHAINEGRNTTLHLRELMTRYSKENLPPDRKQRSAFEKRLGSVIRSRSRPDQCSRPRSTRDEAVPGRLPRSQGRSPPAARGCRCAESKKTGMSGSMSPTATGSTYAFLGTPAE